MSPLRAVLSNIYHTYGCIHHSESEEGFVENHVYNGTMAKILTGIWREYEEIREDENLSEFVGRWLNG